MKRLMTSAAVAAVLVAGTGSGAQAQGGGASLFDLGVYGGVAYHYNWLDNIPRLAGNDDDALNPGFSPNFGAHATFWAAPAFGIRTNVNYSPIDMPVGAAPDFVNGWFYDLNLVLRPWIGSTGSALSSLYVFLGGGAFTANPPGEGSCMHPFGASGACLAGDWRVSTVGQGTAGLGMDLFSLTNAIGLFVEGSANVYDSPFHVRENSTIDDTYGVTGRLVAGLKLALGGAAPPPMTVPVSPTPPPPPPPPMPQPTPPALQNISVCVVQGGQLTTVSAQYNPATGDTTVAGGARFSTQYSAAAPTYAGGATWFINTDSVTFNNRQYVKFGVTRVIPATQLTSGGTVQGTTVFTESGAASPAQVIYVPVRPGCEFQPYQLRTTIQPRG